MAKQTFPGFFSIQHPRNAGKGGNIENGNIAQNAHFLHKKEREKGEKGGKEEKGEKDFVSWEQQNEEPSWEQSGADAWEQ